eukprot:GEMP01063246.1.p1 GENE.GEMP01063246.1~~GEMP01063246.1.p1  ORF type:complete len:268 (+),score=65.13 GEMP01063246.1:26-829(+)
MRRAVVRLCVRTPPRKTPLPPDYQMPILVRKDGEYVVVSKPHDLRLHHGHTGESVESLLNIEMQKFRVTGQLDYATSGCMFIAQSAQCSREANLLWEGRRVTKVYLALVAGRMPLFMSYCNTPIAKPKEGEFAMRLYFGKPSSTIVHPITHAEFNGRDVTMVALRPITGRRHQLRLHCVSLGHPIVGDPTYGDHPDSMHAPIEAERMMLHCWRLRVPLSSGELIANDDDVLSEYINRPPIEDSPLLDPAVVRQHLEIAFDKGTKLRN